MTGSDLQINAGSVILGFDVDKTGHTRNIKLIMLKGPDDYVKPSIKALEKYRYAPRFVDGKPVVVKNLKMKYTFLIEN